MENPHAHTEQTNPFDVVIVGGGPAGLAAALQLARSRRSVVVVDAGQPRNAPAAHMHAYLGHDGRPPSEFLAIAQAEVRGYGAQLLDGTATQVTTPPDGDGFLVILADGRVLAARRVLAAMGLLDVLPDIPGVAQQWGRGVLHCPYCHGWEVADQRIAVIATSAMSAHQALLFRQLSDHVTVIVHDTAALDDDSRARLAARGIRILDGPVAAVISDNGTLQGVRLANGHMIDADAVVVAPRFVARTEPLRPLGITPVSAPMGAGEMIPTDDRGATSVPGVYAAGNIADVSHQVLQAAAQGSRVGAVINADLANAEADLALAAHPGDGAGDWDRRYTSMAQHWSGRPNGALVAETAHLSPGTALDIGCGEGADAIWLAQQGWTVTATDISQVALDRAQHAADTAGVKVNWARGDLASDPPPPGPYDLVSIHYPALRLSPDGPEIIATILHAVAPGGTLLFVGHDMTGHDMTSHGGHHHGFDPDDYIQPPDLARHLDQTWTIEVQQIRPRVKPAGEDGPDKPDVILRARRAHGAITA